jgi:hypothetical protein
VSLGTHRTCPGKSKVLRETHFVTNRTPPVHTD